MDIVTCCTEDKCPKMLPSDFLSLFLWLCEGAAGVIAPVLTAFLRPAPCVSAGDLLLGILGLKAGSHLEGPLS